MKKYENWKETNHTNDTEFDESYSIDSLSFVLFVYILWLSSSSSERRELDSWS
jgi:hypothetical protein